MLNYGYDQLNHMTSFVQGSGTTATSNPRRDTRVFTYGFNGDGLRMTKAVNGNVIDQAAWSATGGLPMLMQDSTYSYIYGPAGPIAEITSAGAIQYLHTDQIGSVRLITNASDASVATYSFDPYGNLTSAAPAISNPVQFQGQYLDAESGLYYLRARYYGPAEGQFTTVDPAVAATESPYRYAADSPLIQVDPTGLYANEMDTGGGGFGTAGGGGGFFDPVPAGTWVAENPLILLGPAGIIAIGCGLLLAKGDQPKLKARDALREENRKAEQAADVAGLNMEGRDQLHREISKQGYDYEEVLAIARQIAKTQKWRIVVQPRPTPSPQP